MAAGKRTWWRLVEEREFSEGEAQGAQFARCGHVFWKGRVITLLSDVIEVDVWRMAEDDVWRRSVDPTIGDFFWISREAFPQNGSGFQVGDDIIMHCEFLPNSVRTVVGRMKSRMRQKRDRTEVFERHRSLDLLDWGDPSPMEPAVASGRRAYPADPERAAWEEIQRERWSLMRYRVAELFDPPNRHHRLFEQPNAYLKGMRVVDPSEFDLDGFRAVGKSDYVPRPGALLDVRKLFLAEGEYPSDDLRRCGIPQDQGYVVEIPFVEAIEADDPRILTDETLRSMVLGDAKYRETIPGFLFMNDRPAGVEEGILTRLWIPRPEGGSFCHVKAEWMPGGLDP